MLTVLVSARFAHGIIAGVSAHRAHVQKNLSLSI